ncbi:MAG: bifunctional alpha/beta hydrolase/OsmC family protein [Gammaproteobacteria bacterium]|nr:bifunctional alpha/beta hydrolase/OsmC family protein [Gammaproteobacteria bacterium]
MPQRKKVSFAGATGDTLAGLLELPDRPPVAYALFAHCFTCGKDIAAATRIARALLQHGIATLRFDFTGLGNSDGDFANTNFSSNVQDLIAAADFLRSHYQAPKLLIGHSLGGTAVLNAAKSVPECVSVVTIGSPADAQHVAKQFACDIDAINSQGEAEVSLAGRQFRIRKQFLKDIEQTSTEHIKTMGKALLVMHSPTDAIVSIHEAERIYLAAAHPKSFVSLDNADHLLTRAPDAEYVANTIAVWVSRFLPPNESPSLSVSKGEVQVHENNHVFTLDVFSDSHQWVADEPVQVGGNNTGPDPYEHLLASVGTCTAMTLRMYATRKQWPLKDAKIVLSHSREHVADCKNCDSNNTQLDVIHRTVELVGELSSEQRARLMEIADKCPVHKTLTGQLVVRTEGIN